MVPGNIPGALNSNSNLSKIPETSLQDPGVPQVLHLNLKGILSLLLEVWMFVPPQPPDQQVPKVPDFCHLTALGQQVFLHGALKGTNVSPGQHCHPRGLSRPSIQWGQKAHSVCLACMKTWVCTPTMYTKARKYKHKQSTQETETGGSEV